MIMRHFFLTVLLVINIINTYGQNNDHMFPPSAVAKPYINYDSKGFIIEGKRTFLVSAGLEYSRIPHELWYDRLLRIKRAGFNCIEIYTIWNFHEAQDGKFDFTGDRDLGKFLNTVKELGMYAIVRVGPYYCAEWDLGGYPIWLKFKKGVSVREDNKPFEKYVDRFFDHLLPIVFKQQINNGGPVILVQLENEHPGGWGTVVHDAYFAHLQQKALQMGLQVPYFFSGLHHATDPAEDEKLDDPARPNPWFSTEFWSVWYSQYGAKPGDADLYDSRTWKIIANGGNGYNYYMVHGGSNFGYTNNDEDAACYDYGAAIGQAGDLRPIYYTFKRAAWFGRSFQEILENSTDATAQFSKAVTDTALKLSARKSAVGDIIFIENKHAESVSTNINIEGLLSGKKITLRSKEIYPLIHNYTISDAVTLKWAFSRIFAIVKQDNTTTVIVDAEAGSPLLLQFATASSKDLITIDEVMPAGDKPKEYLFKTGINTIRVLAMNRQQTDKTWITAVNGKNYIISGMSYVGDVKVAGQQFSAVTEQPLTEKTPEKGILYTDKGSFAVNTSGTLSAEQTQTITFSNWEYKNAGGYAKANVNTSTWFKSEDPSPMGADGNITANTWYRTTLHVPSDGKYTIQVNGAGRAQAFIDGKPALKWNIGNEVSLDLKKGSHSLAIFVGHDGRDKLAAYIGPIDKVDNKGFYGSAFIKKGGPFITELTDWYSVNVTKKGDAPAFDTAVYKKYKIGDDVFDKKEGYAWFYTALPALPEGISKMTLLFKSVDENATVFLNGKEVAHHDGWNQAFEVTITDTAILNKPIALTVFIENHSNEGGIDQPVRINNIGNAERITGWQMKTASGESQTATGWLKYKAGAAPVEEPCFYRASFTVPKTTGGTFIWRFSPQGLGHGSVWVNGHNLGRYPEKLDMKSLYIPECWLHAGVNQVMIYDEDGKHPDSTDIIAETQAGRSIHNFTTKH